MKILTIIGNGFDLGHDLPTQFDNFIKSNYNIFSQKYGAFRNENNNWKDVESQYKQLLCKIMRDRKGIDITEEIDNIIQGYGFNEYGEVDYYNYTSAAFMEEFEKQGGISFLLIYYAPKNEFYYLTYQKLREFWDRMLSGGRKSFRYDELDKKFLFISGNGVFVPFLEVLQIDLDLRD
ncbi:hypothetical protein CG709_17240 [Lachnotalea glycerini]|nr:hypothetical protein CG709_17240 [Lachnotalea glycerini]